MKIAIVGDPHISTGFRARVDDYLHAVLNKISEIADNNDRVIFLGDVFDTSAMPTFVFNETYRLLSKYDNDKFHTILGNHDLFHRNLKALNRTTIGSLNLTQVLHVHTEPFTIDGYNFVPVMTDDDVEKIHVAEDNDTKSVLLGHKYFEFYLCPEESITQEDIERLKYKWVFLGHDHCPYSAMQIGQSVLYRPGSLTRTTVDLYNKDRDIQYYQIDTETDTVCQKSIHYLPSDQVYLKGSFDKKDEKVARTKQSNLVKLLARFDRRQKSSISLDKTLLSIGGTQEQVQYLRELHRMHNIKYN